MPTNCGVGGMMCTFGDSFSSEKIAPSAYKFSLCFSDFSWSFRCMCFDTISGKFSTARGSMGKGLHTDGSFVFDPTGNDDIWTNEYDWKGQVTRKTHLK